MRHARRNVNRWARSAGLVAAIVVVATSAAPGAAEAARPGRIVANGTTAACSLTLLTPSGRRVRCIKTPGVARSPGGAALSPDGKRLAFYAGRKGGQSGLYVIGTNGRGLRAFVPPSAGLADFAAPVWSPDGVLIAARGTRFDGTPDYESDILVNSQTGAVVQTGLVSLHPLVFSEDAARVYSADISLKRSEIASVPVAGGVPEGYGRGLDEQQFPNGVQGLSMDLDPKGGRALVLIAAVNPTKDRLAFQSPGGAPVPIPTDSPDRTQDAQAVFSPDGSRIAVVWGISPSSGSGFITGQLDLLRADGTRIRTVSRGWSSSSTPSWAPDSSAFTVNGRVGFEKKNPQLGARIVTREGRDVTPKGLRAFRNPSWSPPGAGTQVARCPR